MIQTILIATATFLVCSGTPVRDSSRQGSFNTYHVYTRLNPRVPVAITDDATTIAASPLVLTRNTAIIVHGHQASGFSSLNPVVKDAFLSSEDCNVIVVDWSLYSHMTYANAVTSVPSVAVFLANLISTLVTAEKVALARLHLVGFNLGAHVVGFTGRFLNGAVARITGLDPSGSQWGSSSGRLSMNDAQYVEVIHTDGDGLLANGLGTAIGHVDFFPNGGSNQPGCFLSKSCSHNRAWEFFAASLENDHLIGNRCTTNLQLSLNQCRGYALNMGNNEFIKYGSGTYRVNTKSTYPF